jgi:hypothetical protein
LYDNYPNPFSNSTDISYYIPEVSDVNLRIYDLRGQMIKELVNSNQSQGEHSLNFSSENLSDGVYMLSIIVKSKNNHFHKTKLMLLSQF